MKEADIRPKELLDTYLALSLKDAQLMDRTRFVSVACPACRSEKNVLKFIKNGFNYAQCTDCGSVFCSPRPDPETLLRFYEKGESSDYWARVFFPAVAEARREKLFRKKAEEIKKLLSEKGIGEQLSICDVGAGYGIFLEELARVFPRAHLAAIEPGEELASRCRDKGFETLQTYSEGAKDWENCFDLVLSSEVIEHVFSPERFVESLFRITKPGGFVLLTGLGYEGFDILVLQEKSKSIFPPHHINFLSLNGFKNLFDRTGFVHSEIWTPGMLDVDIVMNSGLAPEFLTVLAKRPEALEDLQSLLRKHSLSSHIWVLASKK